MTAEQPVRIRVAIHALVNGKYKKHTSRNISIFDNASIDEVQNIILNALARYGIKHKYSWYGSRELAEGASQ